MKQAADAAGRKICFIGMSLTTYLEAAHREGRAPFDPKELVAQEDMDSVDPNKLLVVTTGSQVPATSAHHSTGYPDRYGFPAVIAGLQTLWSLISRLMPSRRLALVLITTGSVAPLA